MKRVQKSTKDLKVGEKFYWSETTKEGYAAIVIAQGPKVYAFYDPTSKSNKVSSGHYPVWVDAPRSTVADFEVGERVVLASGSVYKILGLGKNCALVQRESNGYEFLIDTIARCTEVPEEAEPKPEHERTLRNTNDLNVGDVFYLTDDSRTRHMVVAQGPEMYGWQSECHYGLSAHDDVWVEREGL